MRLCPHCWRRQIADKKGVLPEHVVPMDRGGFIQKLLCPGSGVRV